MSFEDFKRTRKLISREQAISLMPELEDSEFDYILSYNSSDNEIGYIMEMKGDSVCLTLENMTYVCAMESEFETPTFRDLEKVLYLYSATNTYDVYIKDLEEIEELAKSLPHYEVAYVFNWIEEVKERNSNGIRF